MDVIDLSEMQFFFSFQAGGGSQGEAATGVPLKPPGATKLPGALQWKTAPPVPEEVHYFVHYINSIISAPLQQHDRTEATTSTTLNYQNQDSSWVNSAETKRSNWNKSKVASVNLTERA